MAVIDRFYRCLNPVGIAESVDTSPLAPRLESLAGKEIWLSICGEPDVTDALEKRLKSDYPDVSWKVKRTHRTTPIPLSDEEMQTCDGLIQGVAW